MKKNTHPKTNPTIFIDSSSGTEFITTSTLRSEETKEVDGVKYQIINIEISSASHPFYTGKQVLLDAARRVEKFQERAAKQGAISSARKGKKGTIAKAKAKKGSKEETPETK